ncbi:unnamed protein product [Zymoseptoria tritici ST99CH_1A5]|uniref:histidine kinase n=1 Tax=Zymoseptoria tritici ST99CH_1A5 TaxID=1276529 RepID=A0A1Y6LCR6_ZYMTR|nr:unnamed protein product [Zymoseptoria tritici ST99CH_1A5]
MAASLSEAGDAYTEPEDVGEERARELYQYYRPPKEVKDQSLYLPYPDTVLQAHAQLAAYRLDVRRALIGLVDKDSSYFVAEATKTMDLEDHKDFEHADDDLYEIPAYYEVLDMATEARWQSIYTGSERRFRYYLGIPLRTENNINIGALFLLDSRPRPHMETRQMKVLHTLANNIVAHMKTVKESHEKQRAIRMNWCVAEFISLERGFRTRRSHSYNDETRAGQGSNLAGSSQLLTPNISRQSSAVESSGGLPSGSVSTLTTGCNPRSAAYQTVDVSVAGLYSSADQIQSTQTDSASVNPAREQTFEGVARGLGNGTASSEELEESRGRQASREARSSSPGISPSKPSATEAGQQSVFDRAAYLLREALDLEPHAGGGVVLFDTNALADNARPTVLSASSDHGDPRRMELPQRNSSESVTGTGVGAARSAYSGAIRERVVLGAASINRSSGRPPANFGRADTTFKVTLTPPELQRMCRRHPRGRLYNIPDNTGTTLFDYEGRHVSGALSAQLYEMVLIRRQFPDAKQVIFIPIFHANVNRWTSCFAFTTSRYRVFSHEMDYLPMLSFCSVVKAEMVRLGTFVADEQKGDFIGSVSHELRSPLHGILASIELLQSTDCDGFQRSCVDTMDACAHTLLDTISMVLDYNKVSNIRRACASSSNDSAHRDSKMPTTTNLRQEPLFVTDQSVDVALLTEEVVDELAMAHLAKVRTHMDFDDTSPSFNGTLHDVGVRPSMKRVLNAMRPQVEMILDIQGTTDWYYSTQPGAIRRIVMNLFGNSLKYTKHGNITVSLRTSRVQRSADPSARSAEETPSIIKIIVKDTGHSMSPEYLKTKLFTPFAQENAKAAGTGLGLPIVKAIVNMLHGEIDIKSIVNVGTVVVVTIPMKKTTSGVTRGRTASPSSRAQTTGHFTKDSIISELQSLEAPPQTAIYEPAMEFDSFGQTQGAAAVHSALAQYLTGWFGWPVMQTWDFDIPAQILLVDEMHLATLLAQRPLFLETLSRQSIIILCANPSRQAIMSRDIRSSQVEAFCKPFGPHKLAKALSRALEKSLNQPTDAQRALSPHGRYVSARNSEQSPGNSRASSRASAKTDYSGVAGGIDDTQHRHLQQSRRGSLSQRIPFRSSVEASKQRFKEVSAGTDGGFPFPNSGEGRGQPQETRQDESPISPNTQPLQKKHEDRPAFLSPPSFTWTLEREQDKGKTEDSRASRDAPGTESVLSSRHLVSTSGHSEELATSLVSLPREKKKSEMEIFNSASQAAPFHSTTTGSTDLWTAPSSPQTRRPRLLLVDDNKLNLQLLHTFVKQRHYGEDLCQLAEDGSQAVTVFDSFAPDIVFMDISMPVMDGIEATRCIRRIEASRWDSDKTPVDESGPRPPKPALVVALTGNAKGSDQAEALKSGVDVYMTKPCSFKRVGQLLDNWREEDRP